MERRLAAILVADVVDYTRQMAEDQQRTLAVLRELRDESFRPIVEEHGGHVVKSMGDGWIVEFSSISNAVEAAIAVQTKLVDHDTIRLRMGVHIGDVVFENEDVFGDGVNVAARLESIAAPGQILISDTAQNSLDHATAQNFVSGEERQLKGIERSIRVWRWPAEQTLGSETGQFSGSSMDGVLMIAFPGLLVGGGDEVGSEICEGVNEAVRTALANQSKVTVIADEDRADLLIQGTLKIAQDRYRATIRLLDQKSGELFKAERFDGTFDDEFTAEDDIARKIYAFTRFAILDFERLQLANFEGPLESLNTDTLLSQAAACFFTPQVESYLSLRRMCQIVLARNPDNRGALTMSACSYLAQTICGWRHESEQDRLVGLDLAQRATRLYPENDFAFVTMSWLLLDFKQDYDGAILAAERALEITPNQVQALSAFGNAMVLSGELEIGLDAQLKAAQAFKSNRLYPFCVPYFAAGLVLAKRFKEALDWCRRADRMVVDVPNILLPMISAAAHANDLDEARRISERLIAKYPDFNLREMRKWPFKNPRDWDFFVGGLQIAGLPDRL
jgi:adenylate cyclase